MSISNNIATEYDVEEYKINDDDWNMFMTECITITYDLNDYIDTHMIRMAFKSYVGNTKEVQKLQASQITRRLFYNHNIRVSWECKGSCETRAVAIGLKLKWPKKVEDNYVNHQEGLTVTAFANKHY